MEVTVIFFLIFFVVPKFVKVGACKVLSLKSLINPPKHSEFYTKVSSRRHREKHERER